MAVNALYDRGEMSLSAEIYAADPNVAPAAASARDSVRSEGDAIALSSVLWDEMSGFPAVRLMNEGRIPS